MTTLPITYNRAPCAVAGVTEASDWWNATVYQNVNYCTVNIAGPQNKTVTGYFLTFGI